MCRGACVVIGVVSFISTTIRGCRLVPGERLWQKNKKLQTNSDSRDGLSVAHILVISGKLENDAAAVERFPVAPVGEYGAGSIVVDRARVTDEMQSLCDSRVPYLPRPVLHV